MSERLVFGSPEANRLADQFRDEEYWEKWEREADPEFERYYGSASSRGVTDDK